MERLTDYTSRLKAQGPLLGAQLLQAFAASKGDKHAAAGISATHGKGWERANEVCKNVVTAMASGDAANVRQQITLALRALYRPQTIIGRLGLQEAPFDARLVNTTAGASGAWVGRGAGIPLEKQTLASLSTSLERTKVATIIPLDEELVRSADIVATQMVARDAGRGLAATEDLAFIDPANSGSAGVRPSAITNGATTATSSGTTAAAFDADFLALLQSASDAGCNLAACEWVVSERMAVLLRTLRGSSGAAYFPGVAVAGVGELHGIRQISSAAVRNTGSPSESFIALIDTSAVWLAQANIDVQVATSGALELVDNPTSSAATGTPANVISLLQTGFIAVRAVQAVNWARAFTGAVHVLRGIAA